VLVQGHLSGDIDIDGHLIVWTGACVSGRIRVKQNLYLFGQLGLPDDGKATTLECQDQAFIAKTGVSIATLLAKRLQLYEGADLQGAFKTLKQGNELPVLSDAYNQNQT
jgi:cytoskeletal protein CcmA (bactofilin family)